MNPDIYERYTGKKNDLLRQNLTLLLELVSPDRVTVRLPLIPGFNTEADRTHSQSVLSQMGVTKFNHLTYQVKK
jgi:pyruvate formate lyase activating enzyme